MTRFWQELHPQRLIPSLTAGFISGSLLVIYAVSRAALIFSGDLAAYLPIGIGLALWTVIIVNLAVALLSSVKGVVVTPQDAPAVIAALMANAIALQLAGTTSDTEIIDTIVIAIALSTLLTGLFLLLLGACKLGNLTRFIPYPVVGGFLAGVGWLVAQGAIYLMSDHFFSLNSWGWFWQSSHLAQWLPGAGFAIVCLVLLRRVQNVLLLPGLIVGASILFYLVLALTGTSLQQAQTQGLLIAAFPDAGIWPPQIELAPADVNWGVVFSQAGHMLSMALLSAIALLLNSTGIEMAARRDCALNRELKVTGAANVVAALGGGIPGFHSLGLSVLSCAKLNANSRLVGVIAASICALVLFVGSGLIYLLPKAVLGGVTLYIGLSCLVEWLYDARSTLPTIDYGLVIVIWLVIATVGFLPGVALGLAIALILFMVTYIRMDVVRHQFSGASYLSKQVRPVHQAQLLQAEGEKLSIYVLQGFIFFGTANQLLNRIRQRLALLESPLSFLLLDFRLVRGLDSSAVMSFNKIQQLAEHHNFKIVLTHLADSMRHQIAHNSAVGKVSAQWQILPDLDRGVEWCEEEIIAAVSWRRRRVIPLALQLEQQLSSASTADILMDYLEEVSLEIDAVVFTQADPADALYVIESGQVATFRQLANGQTQRVQTIGAGNLLGEQAFYQQSVYPISAIANQPTVLYRLSLPIWTQIQQDHLEVAIQFQNWILRRLSAQLTLTYQEIDELLR